MVPNLLNPFIKFPSVGAVGGWVELGRETLSSAAATMSVTGIADKRYLKFIWHTTTKPSARETRMRVGNGSFDTGSNYAARRSVNGGTDVTSTSNTSMIINNNALNSADWGIGYISNLSGKEKLCLSWMEENIDGAANVPAREETVNKWANTSVSIDQLQVLLNGSGNFGSGSEFVVLGWDPADTHTTNFWEELASVELTSSSSTLDTTAFTAKKYLWVQAWYKGTSTTAIGNTIMRVGNGTVDTGSVYANRWESNGTTDVTQVSQTSMRIYDDAGGDDTGFFINFFVINNSSNEKLIINHGIQATASGAGTAPARMQSVHKWADTTNQINRIELTSGTSFDTGSIIKVWGSN